MDKSRLPVVVKSKLKPPQDLRPNVTVNRPVNRLLLRRSKSVSDLQSVVSLPTKSKLTVTKKVPTKTVVDKPSASTFKTSLKRPATTESGTTSAPKISKPVKIPPYDYKARFNLQVEKNLVLQTNLKQKELEVADIKRALILENEQNLLKIQQFEINADKLQCTLKASEDECLRLKTVIKALTFEKEKFKDVSEMLTKKVDTLNNQTLFNSKVIAEQEILIKEYKNRVQELEESRRAMHNQVQDLKGTIRVFCRVRPQLLSEADKLVSNMSYIDEDSLEIRKTKFVFDKVFQPESTQSEIFQDVSELIQSAIDGYNVCIFAYGQTGSGKTYTMQGEECDNSMGIIPRCVDLLFQLVEKYRLMEYNYTVHVSFLEIYNESVRDLLERNEKKCLEIRYNEGRGTSVSNLITQCVQSPKELHSLMQHANQNRAVAVTNYNEHSSRSHAVTKITLIGTNTTLGIKYTGSISLVDLAGSESAKTSERMTETKNINRSLSALGTVMMALQNKESHIPYRNSKLTYLLQSSLGGNSKTLMFVNIAPLDEFYGENVSALRFASNVKEVKVRSSKNKAYLKRENDTEHT